MKRHWQNTWAEAWSISTSDRMRSSPALWDEALDIAADTLEDEGRKRAFDGSDVLLMFLLKGLRPQKWRESRATIPLAELNKMIEVELQRIAKQKEVEALEPVN
jgi:hypothetical protein